MQTKNMKKLYAAFVVFAVGMLVSIPLRAFQAARLIEPETGFYTDPSNITVAVFYAAIGIVSVAIFALLFFKTSLPVTMPEGRDALSCISSFFLAITIIIDASLQVFNIFSIINSFSTLVSSYTFSGYFSKSGGYSLIVEVIFGALSAMFLAIFGMYRAGLFGTLSRFKLLAACPLIWIMSRIVVLFLKTIRILNVSDLFLSLLMLIFSMLFFLAFARIVSNIEPQGAVKRVYPYGLIAALLLACVSLPKLMLYMMGMKDKIPVEYPLNLCDLGMFLFIMTFLFSAIKTEDDKSDDSDKNEKENDGGLRDNEENTGGMETQSGGEKPEKGE